MATAHGLSGRGKLKLLFILDDFPDPTAGTEGQFWLLFRRLDRSLVEPTIALLRPSAWLEQAVKDAPLRVLNVARLRSLSGLGRILAAVRWARREGFAVAHIFFNDSALAFPLPLKLAGIRVIVSRRDLGFWYTRGNLPLLRFNRRFVDAVVANARAVKSVVEAREGYPGTKVRVIYNGLSRTEEGAVVDARERYGVPPDAPLLAVVANLRPLKRIGDVIRALALLARTDGAAHLLVIGEDRAGTAGGSHRAELELLAAALGVGPRVHFAGKIADPMPLLKQASLCLLCSESEGLSNAIIEYMFAGCPVVCTQAGGNSELVEHGVNGLVVPIGDVAAIAAAVHILLGEPALRQRMAGKSRERALALFHPDAMVRAHMDLYAQLREPAP